MAVNETTVTGRVHRILIDKAQKLWQRTSFWTRSPDVEFNDGTTAENKVGAIKGITTDTNTTTVGYAADMTTVVSLMNRIAALEAQLTPMTQAQYNAASKTNRLYFIKG